ncbi:MAG: T9SS type A sorting domain-containing protein, partial [Bacteroidales bacterium]|nr:T9SS type A sorting domain-containing protein [Bacteroidales bacterium]
GSSANYTCRLYGCDYVALDGLTIRAIGASYARPIDIENGSTYITIRNCVIEAPLTTNNSQNQSAIYEGTGTNSYTLIENNIISNGSYGIYFDGGSGIEIRDNRFTDQYYMGISVDNCPEVKITGNEILATNSYSSYQAIHTEYCDNQIEIVANKIDLQTGYYGLYLYYCEANLSNSGLIANNFISVGGSSGTGIGIYSSYSTYQNFYYNSVNVTRYGSGNYAFYQNDSYNSYNLQLQNNIFANQSNGMAIRVTYTSALNISDYNNFYSAGSTLGMWGSSNCSTLLNWKSYSSLDANSLSVNPGFISNTDLHICNSALDGVGYPILQITTDIDGQYRDLFTPDIGADEFDNSLSLDLPSDTVFCGSGILHANSPGATYSWSTGESSESIQVSQPGQFWVEVSNACGTMTDTVTVNILSQLIVELGADTTICDGSFYTLDAGMSAGDYTWSNGGVGQSVTISTPGVYWVEVSNGNCSGSDTISVGFGTTPVSTFTVDANICETESAMVQFAGTATSAANYIWDFDGGIAQPGTGLGPHQVQWSTPGSYTISLMIEDNGCLSTEISNSVTLHQTPTANFTISTASLCENDTATITYLGNATTGATYNWNFGTATIISSSGQGPYEIQFSTSGNYSISLDVEEAGCQSQVFTQNLQVNPIPDASFITSSSNICAGDTVTMTYTGSSPNATGITWYYGSGNIINGSGLGPREVLFSYQGNIDVSLILYENGCQSNQFTNTILVNPIPSSSFIISSINLCSLDTLQVNYSGSATTSANYSWDFSTGSVISGSNAGPFELNWANAGSFDILLNVEENGCYSDTTSHTVTVIQSPGSDFNISNPVCVGEEATVTYLGLASITAIYNWDFDGATNTPVGQGPHNVNWAAEGLKTVRLIVEENNCPSLETSIPVVVNPVPDPPTINLMGNIFTSSSTSNNQWLLNGVPITGATSQFYTASETGFYQVEVSNIYGCTSITDMVYFDYNSVDIAELGNSIIVYPNPAREQISVDASGIGKTVYSSILDLNGREIMASESQQSASIYTLDISNLAQGTYILKLYNNEFVEFRRIVVE